MAVALGTFESSSDSARTGLPGSEDNSERPGRATTNAGVGPGSQYLDDWLRGSDSEGKGEGDGGVQLNGRNGRAGA